MANYRKGFSASRSKLMSFRMRRATLGTHVSRRPHRPYARLNDDAVDFSSARKKKRAVHACVDNVFCKPEQNASYRMRQAGKKDFSQSVQRRARLRRICIAIACILLVVCVAAGVGTYTFFNTISNELALKDSDVCSVLVAPTKEESVFYTVICADLDQVQTSSTPEGPDMLMLVRVDTKSRAVTLISLPPCVQTVSKDGKVCSLREIQVSEGDAALIRSISVLCGVDIAHFVSIDAEGIARVVDAIGGICVEVSEEVDDPTAGSMYIPAGKQHLDGQGVLTLLRARNFSDSLPVQTAHQRAVVTEVSLRLLGADSFDFLLQLDKIKGLFGTDMSLDDARDVATSLRGIHFSEVSGALMPGYSATKHDETVYVLLKDDWEEMMDKVCAGQSPVVEKKRVLVDPGSFTLEIRNGGGITGAAARISDTLESRGFSIEACGNTDVAAYSETLVIYKDEEFASAADTVVSTLGMGRVIRDTGFYAFDTDVLLILGKDWKPSV